MRAIWVLAVFLLGGGAQAYVLREDSGGHPVRWAGPVSFAVQSDFAEVLNEPRAMEAVEGSLETWHQVLPDEGFDLRVDPILDVGFDLSGLAQQNAILVPPVWIFSPDAIAVTVITVDNQAHQIVDADISLNPKRTFRVLPPEGLLNTSDDDIQNALTHELGHALGLAHNPELPTAVMYPSARAGETTKRTLSQDDLDAIAALYGLPAPSGCSTTGASAAWLGLMVLALLAVRPLRRHAGLVALVALAPFAAQAADSPRAPAPADTAQVVLVGTVTQVRTLAPTRAQGPLLLFSELTVRVDRCLKGSCPETVVLHVAGGHWGRYEQYVADSPLPKPGEALGLTVDPGAEPATPPVSKVRLYALDQPRDFTAFARGLSAAHLDGAVR